MPFFAKLNVALIHHVHFSLKMKSACVSGTFEYTTEADCEYFKYIRKQTNGVNGLESVSLFGIHICQLNFANSDALKSLGVAAGHQLC